MMDTDMQCGQGAHGMSDDMRLVDVQCVHQRDHVVAGDILTVFGAIGRHVGWRITALRISDAPVRAREEAHLRLPGAPIAGIFVHEDDRRPLPGLLEIQPNPIPRADVRHSDPLLSGT
jgi:hypothetical protein